MPNASFDNMMNQALGGIDPFAQARQQAQAQQSPPTAQMQTPFPEMNLQSPQPVAQGSQQNLSSYQSQSNLPKGSFTDLAAQQGIDPTGLHKNPTLARLQLAQQLQEKHGPGFMAHPQNQQLMQAFDSQYPAPGQSDQRDLNASSAKADRTLKALLGGPP